MVLFVLITFEGLSDILDSSTIRKHGDVFGCLSRKQVCSSMGMFVCSRDKKKWGHPHG